jgi:hypothetical protein
MYVLNDIGDNFKFDNKSTQIFSDNSFYLEQFNNNYNNNNYKNNDEEQEEFSLYFCIPQPKDKQDKNNISNKKTCDLSTKATNFINPIIENNKLNLENEVKNEEKNEDKNEEKKDAPKLLGRKSRKSNETGEHNKFSDDNLRRKVKHIILDELMKFINNKICTMYNNNIGHGIFIKKLLIMNQKQKCDATVLFNKEFLNKTLKDIFSDRISSRFTIFPLDHNKKLIYNLMNETDEEKKNYFEKLFNLTFIQCLRHFRGDEMINELTGFKGINYIKELYADDKYYLKSLIF